MDDFPREIGFQSLVRLCRNQRPTENALTNKNSLPPRPFFNNFVFPDVFGGPHYRSPQKRHSVRLNNTVGHILMKPIQIIVIALCLTIASRADSEIKAKLIHEIVQLQGVDEMLRDAKKAATVQAQEMVKQMFDQVRASMPTLPKEKFDAIQSAADKLLLTVQGSWTTDEAIGVWEAEYTTDMTEGELREILEACKTPIGRKQIVAGKRAGYALQKYLLQCNKVKLDGAVREYVAEVQRIVSDSAVKK